MIERLIDIIKKEKGYSAYKIKTLKVKSKELFFIRDELDMNRAKDTYEIFLTIYKDFDENMKSYRGESTVCIYNSMSDDEIREQIKKAVYSASFVKNKWFPIVKDVKGEYIEEEKDMKLILKDIYDIVYKDYGVKSEINSCEIFVSYVEEEMVNSAETKIKQALNKISVELISDAKGKEEDVEVFKIYNFSNLDKADFENKVKEQLIETEHRAQAVKSKPIESVDLIISGDDIKHFFDYYVMQAQASTHYKKINRIDMAKEVHPNASGDKPDITMLPFLEGSTYSKKYDDDGLELEKVHVIEKGRLLRLNADLRYSSYLGIAPTGHLVNFEVAPGSMTIKEMQSKPYFKILIFSSFQMDNMTGVFGGEFRLAEYFDGEKTIYVNNGAFSANLFEKADDIHYSKETVKLNFYHGPKAVLIKEVSIG